MSWSLTLAGYRYLNLMFLDTLLDLLSISSVKNLYLFFVLLCIDRYITSNFLTKKVCSSF
ncbi:hypothetical protein RND71_024254 [Anisodus tanguticus]|uniref:Uncharacterized protein n=1 Tax=Anisodus tanguticus TaxID=243964 RepID=A0AAE1V3T6_9SOLA|nr:hypothetical protein RND71_024254 [Anisodus tanguticus]